MSYFPAAEWDAYFQLFAKAHVGSFELHGAAGQQQPQT